MRKFFYSALLLFFVISLNSIEIPALSKYVNDYAGFISPAAENELEAKLRTLDDTDSTQFVILTIPSLEGGTIEEFAFKTAEKNKIGQKGKGNGVLLLVTKEERKIRIEVGRGLEGNLTDLAAGRIIDNIIKPSFKSGDMDGGFKNGASAVIGIVKGEFKADDLKKTKRKKSDPTIPIVIAIILFFVFIGIIQKFSTPVKGVAGAGFGGAAVSGLGMFLGLPMIAALIVPILIGGGIIGALATLFLTRSSAGGYSDDGGVYHGGFFGGGGFSSGGDSGSSDSGFSGGGGDFGGGGSSGDW